MRSFFLFLLIVGSASAECSHLDPQFNRDEVFERMEACKTAADQFDCVDEMMVKPANLLLNMGVSVGFMEKYGERIDVSPMAHQLYENCTSQLLDSMPDFFAIEVRKLMSSTHYDTKCYDREQLCTLNKAYLYPFVCLTRRKCSMYLSDSYYALIYAHQMLTLETNQPLECGDHRDQDLSLSVFEKGTVFKRGHIVGRHFCRNVPHPPRRVIHEQTADGFKVSIGLEYYW